MVAERRNTQTARSEAMASARHGVLRRPSLAEEIEELEQAEVVTDALQAIQKHGMAHVMSPKGQTPQNDAGLQHTRAYT